MAEIRELLPTLAIEHISLILAMDKKYTLVTDPGWSILFGPTSTAGDMVEHLRTTLASDVFTKRLPDRENGLDYIDLRFGNKVFYKFKSPEASSTPIESPTS